MNRGCPCARQRHTARAGQESSFARPALMCGRHMAVLDPRTRHAARAGTCTQRETIAILREVPGGTFRDLGGRVGIRRRSRPSLSITTWLSSPDDTSRTRKYDKYRR
jgi:hypothetical protein